MHDRPQARTEGLVSEHIDDELVVYDRESHTAHSLSAEAALVWERCDGNRSPAEIGRELRLEQVVVERALGELSRCGLLDDGPAADQGYSRREAAGRLARVGGAAFAAPLIYSVAIGPAMAAASGCLIQGTSVKCTSSSQSGRCNASSGGFGNVVGTTPTCPCYQDTQGNCYYVTSGTNGTSCWKSGSGPCSGGGSKPCCATCASCTSGSHTCDESNC